MFAATQHRIDSAQAPLLRLLTPDRHYLAKEPVRVYIHPSDGRRYSLSIKKTGGWFARTVSSKSNTFELKRGLPRGSYTLRARYVDVSGKTSGWSQSMALVVHPHDERETVESLRVWQHKLAMLVERDEKGVYTITDPWALPPSFPADGKATWFRTAAYEGCTALLNQEESYYRDPMRYLLDSIDQLAAKDCRFLTWDDLMGGVRPNGLSALIQFDVDGGPLSFAKVADALIQRGIRATVMIHHRCHGWYDYTLADYRKALDACAAAGWTIGYHCNALSAAVAEGAEPESAEAMRRAGAIFAEDVAELRKHFAIRTFTHHGGNILNYRLSPPPGLDLVHVDNKNTALWKQVSSSFSDGGFVSLPETLSAYVGKASAGLHFFRIHPFKYGNYSGQWDAPPLLEDQAARAGCAKTRLDEERSRQERWLKQRHRLRIGRRLTYEGPDKSFSRGFVRDEKIETAIAGFLARRSAFFRREYPEPEGDPRVFWWRMLATFGPKQGKVLNVGALPPDRRDENTALLGSTAVVETDIDKERRPDILADITESTSDVGKDYDATLLFGLPYVASPGKAIARCFQVTKAGGIGLFAFPDDRHPMRGAMFNPSTRPLWRHELEPLRNVGLEGNLWSFDEQSLAALFSPWNSYRYENRSNYWFVLAKKDA